MDKTHEYEIQMAWTGNRGSGTSGYRAYDRNHVIQGKGKAPINGSSDPNFRGDATRYNPEELFLASLSACHMLWFLHLCADAGVIVEEYMDRATGTMKETPDGGGYFSEVRLYPRVIVSQASMVDLAQSLHDRAHHLCFIANSCKCPIRHFPETVLKH